MGKDCGSDIGKSDELISPKPTFEEDNCNTNKNLEFNEIDMAYLELVKDLKFGDVATFREAVREANLIKGKDLHFVKNNKDKVIVRCKAEGCKYRVYGSQVTDEMTFQIKTLNPTHTCTRANKNSACTSRWISKRYMQKFRYDLNCPTAGLQKEIKDKFHVDVGRMQVYRARKSAEKVIDGDDNEQYNRIWDYCETLKATNVGTTTLMLVDRPTLDVAGTFQRLYICLQATKEGFKAGCRPLIGLDGCFLKGNQKGQILSAVGRDANEEF